jgi:hypothetical protein
MWAVFDWLGAAMLAIFLVAMVVAAWEHFVRQSEQVRNWEAGAAAARAAGETADPTATAPQALAGKAISRMGQARRAEANWIETRPMVNLPGSERPSPIEVDLLVE